MLRKENGVWWHTKKWIVQSLVWTTVITGSVTFVMYVFTTLPVAAKPDIIDSCGMGAAALQVFFNMMGFAAVIGVIILTHDLIIGERESGTAEWVLSKPLSRKAFVISKLAASVIGITAIIVALQGILLVAVVNLFHGRMDIIPFIKGLSLVWLLCVFYTTLLLFLGTMTRSRGVALGCAFLFFLAGNLVPLLYPESYFFMPWKLTGIAFSISMSTAWSAKMFLPVVMTGIWSILLTAGALWRIERIEI